MHVSTAGLATARLYETTGEKRIEIKEAPVLVKIKLKSYNNVIGFYLLMLAGNVFCLPDNTYIIPEGNLRILDSYRITYEIVDS
ncbi:MAG: hypothetical protein AABY78_02055 [Nitrospirota bacterium]|jgi:hypothetical protein